MSRVHTTPYFEVHFELLPLPSNAFFWTGLINKYDEQKTTLQPTAMYTYKTIQPNRTQIMTDELGFSPLGWNRLAVGDLKGFPNAHFLLDKQTCWLCVIHLWCPRRFTDRSHQQTFGKTNSGLTDDIYKTEPFQALHYAHPEWCIRHRTEENTGEGSVCNPKIILLTAVYLAIFSCFSETRGRRGF